MCYTITYLHITKRDPLLLKAALYRSRWISTPLYGNVNEPSIRKVVTLYYTETGVFSPHIKGTEKYGGKRYV